MQQCFLAMFLIATISAHVQALADESRLKDVIKDSKKSVVTVLVFEDSDDKPDGQGTGWFKGATQVVTNYHVVRRALRVRLVLSDGTSLDVSEFAGADSDTDLVLLHVEWPKNFPPERRPKPLELSAMQPEQGTRVVVIGTPKGLDHTASDGVVSAVREIPVLGSIVQISAPVSEGSSGSPILNMDGKVVGTITGEFADGNALGFGTGADAVHRLQTDGHRPLIQLANVVIETAATDGIREGLALVAAGKYDEAVAALRKEAIAHPDNWLALACLGNALSMVKKWDEAIPLLQEAINKQPNEPSAHTFLALALRAKGLEREARDAFARAAELSPRDPAPSFKLAEACWRVGDEDGFVEALTSGWIRGKDSPVQTAKAYAKTAIRCETPYVAVPVLLVVSSKEGKSDPEIWSLLGKAQRDSRKYDEAIEAYRQAVALTPTDSLLHNEIGRCYLALENYTAARRAFETALALNPDDVAATFNKGLACWKAGDHSTAIQTLEKLRKISPEQADKLAAIFYPSDATHPG
jgi:serine protease Do